MRWFKHFADARHEPKMRRIRLQLGEAGYARAFQLLEMVAELGGSGPAFDPALNLRGPVTDLRWLSDELGISRKETRRTLGIFARVGLMDAAAWRRGCVFIPQMLAWRDEWATRKREAGDLRAPADPVGTNSRAAPEELPSRSQATPDKKEKQRQKQRPEEEEAVRVVPAQAPAPVHPFLAIWNEHCGILPKVIRQTSTRLSRAQARARTYSAEQFTQAVHKARTTPFLIGQNDRGWCATFDWLVRNDENIAKTLEGAYDGKPATKHEQRGTKTLEAARRALARRGEMGDALVRALSDRNE